MIEGIFVNIPVCEVLKLSRKFFEGIGFTVLEKFTGPNSVCLILEDKIKIMLTEKNQFELMLGKPAADKKSSEVLISLTCDSKESVKEITEKALGLGARKVNEFEENEFMYSWAFEDPDGHLWDLHYFK
jgi:predicted lactoylglutathione lyase